MPEGVLRGSPVRIRPHSRAPQADCSSCNLAAYVDILAGKRNGGFTRKYGVKMLVYFEEMATIVAAIQREKTLKRWVRRWKLNLIESRNPDWRDLWDDVGHA